LTRLLLNRRAGYVAAVLLVGATIGLLKLGREQGVTLVILGKSGRPWWWRLLRRSPIDALARTGTGIDVLEIEASAPET